MHHPILEAISALKARPAGAPRPIAVYDLDSTLFCTGPRNLAIARAFAEYRPQLRPFLARLEPAAMGWNVMQDLEAAGFGDAAVLTELRHFWRATFFTDHFVKLDAVYEGAPQLVRALAAAGCLSYYLTGRDEPGMRQGTLEALEAGGFPVPDGRDTILRLKPSWDLNDLVFKTGVFEELRGLGAVALAFENEPGNANRFKEAFPDATVVLHATIHAPDPEPLREDVVKVDSLKVDCLEV